jgi:uncharacterized membrane-anchored protein YjiN (DUF445 family)
MSAEGPALPDKARRMRLVATGLLVAMAATFLVARHFRDLHPAWGFVLAFSEAAMVGGLADWFAVTALFRRPLGLPIPHTAIIPENKDRIADTMAVFLRENFLTPAVVARRMRAMNLAALLGSYLAGGATDGNERLRGGAAGLAGDILRSLDPQRLGGLLKSGMRHQMERIELAPLLGQMIGAAIADKRHMPVMESAIRWAGHTLEENEELVRSLITQRAARIFQLTGLDTKIANAVLDGIYKLLAECAVDPAHPLRRKVEEGLEKLAHDLQHDPVMQERAERMKLELLADPAVANWIDGLWERARAALLRAADNPGAALGGQFGEMLAELGGALEKDTRLQHLINRFARRTAVGVASRYGGQIVRLVSETVKRWDARTVTERIEGAVGRDLQFIRINGTLVGGLVGVAIHAVDGWL